MPFMSKMIVRREADGFDREAYIMSVRINTNIEALDAQRNLSATASTFAKSVEKLSSGLRINRAADDAAGLAISQKLNAQVTGLNQAQRNCQDGISMVQTAEGALNEVHAMLNRIRELAVEAANSTLSSTDAASVSTEITALRAEIDRIAKSTTFNGQSLLTGALSVTQSGGGLAVGAALNTTTNATIAGVDVSGAKASTTYTLTSQAGGKVTLSDGTGLSQQVTLAGTIGASGVETINFGNLGVKITVVGASAKTAADLATDMAGLAVPTVTTGAGTGANFQIGANSGDFLGVSFADAQITAAGYGTWNADISAFATATGNGTGIVNAAQALITSSDTAIGYVSTVRGNLGAIQNRLEHTTASISVASENLNASESRIRDLDVASEMVNFTKTQILQQAGTAILAQANSAPQNILTLLR
jgi:flagellin